MSYLDIISEMIKIMTALASLGAVLMGIWNSHKIKQVHVSINSRMDELLREKGISSRAEGYREAQSAQDVKAGGNGDDYIIGKLKD